MKEVMNSCGTQRRVEDPDARLREARSQGWAIGSGPEDDPQATAEGYSWRGSTCAQITTVHQTGDLEYIPVLGGRT